MDIDIIYRDEDIIVIDKPPGIPVETKNIMQKDCESMIKSMLAKEEKEPYLAVINRLDQPVSGLVLFALNKEAASKLSKDLNEGRIEKYYKARVFREFENREGILTNMLYKDAKNNRSFVVKEKDPRYVSSRKAVLEYREESPGNIEIKLITGRHHQIRVQLAYSGHPILGDTKYGNDDSLNESRKKGIDHLQLFSHRLIIFHPGTGEKMEFLTNRI